jgi:hypothetical protein
MYSSLSFSIYLMLWIVWTFHPQFFKVTATSYMRERPINKNFRALLGLFYFNLVNLVKIVNFHFCFFRRKVMPKMIKRQNVVTLVDSVGLFYTSFSAVRNHETFVLSPKYIFFVPHITGKKNCLKGTV